MQNALSNYHNDDDVQRFALTSNDQIFINGVEYRHVRSDRSGHIIYPVSNKDAYERISHEVLAKCRDEGLFRYNLDYHNPMKGRMRDSTRDRYIQDLSEKNIAHVFWCKEFCDGFLRMEAAGETTRSDQSMRAAIRAINGKVVEIETEKQIGRGRCGDELKIKRAPSPTQLRKWLKKYQAAEGDPMVLKLNYGKSGNRTPRLEPEIGELVSSFAAEHASRTKADQALIHTDLIAELEVINAARKARNEVELTPPSIRAVQRAINKLNPYLDYVGRNGEATARKKFYPVQGGVRARRPYERIEMDEWLVSLQTLLTDAKIWRKLSNAEKKKAKRVRVWVSAAIDAATRCIVALRILTTAPNHESAIATLRMAVSNKRAIAEAAGCQSSWDMEGTPMVVCVDTGGAWYSDEFRMACADLGIEVMYPPAGMPQFRARIERVFGTIHTQLIRRFDGRTFANILIKGEYDAAAHAMMDVKELERLMIRYIVDVYHNTKHGGLGDQTPRNKWKELHAEWGVRPSPDADKVRHIFGTPMERLIQNEGIHCLGSYYRSPELMQLRRSMGARRTKVMTRVDQLDIGEISVRFGRKWVAVPCVREGLDGVSAEEWFELNKQLRRKRRLEADEARPIVNAAIRDFRAFRIQAAQDAGLDTPVYSYSKLMKVEKWFKAAGEQTRAADGDAIDFLGDGEVPEDFVETSPLPQLPNGKPGHSHDNVDDGFMEEDN